MSKITKTFVGARFIHPLTSSYIAAIGEYEGEMIYLDLTDPRITDVQDDEMITATGIAIPFESLQERKFAIALPVEPQVGYNAVALNTKGAEPDAPNALIFGQIVALDAVKAHIRHAGTGNTFAVPVKNLIITRAPRSGADLEHVYEVGSTAVIVDRSDVLGRGTIVTIVEDSGSTVTFEPALELHPYSYIATKASLAPIKEWSDGFSLLGPVNADDTLKDVPASALNNASLGIDIPDTEGLFGAKFTPANDEVPDEGKSLIGAVFSMKELELITTRVLNGGSEDAFANLLGISLLQGRKIDEHILRAILVEEIPYGLHVALPSATEFFEEIGRIAVAQSEEGIRRIAEAMRTGGIPDTEFESASHIAFVRLTGLDPSQPNPPAPSVEPDEDIDNLSIASFLDNRISEGNFEGIIDNEALIRLFEEQGYDRTNGPLTYKISIFDEDGTPLTPTGIQDLAEALKADGLSFEQLVEQSLNDPRPLVPHEDAIGGAREAISRGLDAIDRQEIENDVLKFGLVDFLNELLGDGVVVLPPNSDALEEALADAVAQKAVEEGGPAAGSPFDKLLTETLDEFLILSKIGAADSKLLAQDLTDIATEMIGDLEASIKHVSNIASNVRGIAANVTNDLEDHLIEKTKGRLTSLLNRLENLGKTGRVLNDRVANARALGEGFEALGADVEALKALKG